MWWVLLNNKIYLSSNDPCHLKSTTRYVFRCRSHFAVGLFLGFFGGFHWLLSGFIALIFSFLFFGGGGGVCGVYLRVFCSKAISAGDRNYDIIIIIIIAPSWRVPVSPCPYMGGTRHRAPSRGHPLCFTSELLTGKKMASLTCGYLWENCRWS